MGELNKAKQLITSFSCVFINEKENTGIGIFEPLNAVYAQTLLIWNAFAALIFLL